MAQAGGQRDHSFEDMAGGLHVKNLIQDITPHIREGVLFRRPVTDEPWEVAADSTDGGLCFQAASSEGTVG